MAREGKEFKEEVLWQTEYVKYESEKSVETTVVKVAKINGRDPKVYVRTFLKSEGYTGPTKEGMALNKEQLANLMTALADAGRRLP
jgi:hypothetical protein